MVAQLDYGGLLKSISGAVRRIVKHDHLSLALSDHESGELRLRYTYDDTRGFSSSDIVLPLDRSAAGVAFERNQPTVFRQTDLDSFGPRAALDGGRPSVRLLCAAGDSGQQAWNTEHRQRRA
jgi:hypothetical protein